MIQKVLMAILIFGIFPEALGMLLTKWSKNEHRIFLNYIYGILIEFAVLEVFGVPLILIREPFTRLSTYWFDVCSILTTLSILINISNAKDIFRRFVASLKHIPVTMIFVVILVGLQTFMLVKYCHIDDDDSRFVGNATIAVQHDEMYTEDCATGRWKEMALSKRDILSPFPMFTATIAKHINIHPAAVAHTVFPAIFIPLAYMVFWQVGYNLFEGDAKKVAAFCMVLSTIYIFGDFSTRANFGHLLFRIWQGKAILANIILPASWFVYYECVTENKIVNWITLYIVFIAGCLVSQMGIALLPISIGILTVIYMIKFKSFGYGFKSLCAVIPNIIYMLMYIILTNVE